jgi:hypothetical protein
MENILMPQIKRSPDGEKNPAQETQEVCGYIHDLLGSLEAIAAQHELPVLARLIAMAKSEARDCR